MKRNHEFSKIVYETLQKDNLKDKKSSIKLFSTFKDEAVELTEIFKECEFNIFEHIQMWDHEKKGVISHRMLKEAFSFKFFNFGNSICDIILNLSYRFTLKKSKLTLTEDILIDYVEMCKTMFNLK